MPRFAKGSRVIVSSTSMEHIAQSVSRQGNQTLLNQTAIDPKIIQSMGDQGMAWQTAWGPGTPINPFNPIGEEPRQFEFVIGQNIVQRPRSTENVSFDTMRDMVELYDIAQACIEVRQDELNLDFNIAPYDENDAKKYESEIKAVRAFFEKPDGHMPFDDFQNILAYEQLSIDALTIYPHLTKGGKLGALEAVDGATITPMIDFYGRTPEAPAPAYVQWINGLPWVWLDRNNLIYRPRRKRTNKLYGFSPVEWLLNNINTDVRYQMHFLYYFTEGTVPDTWINAPEGVSDPKVLESLQEMYDSVMAGDQKMKHKIKMMPAGSKPYPSKENKVDVSFLHYLLSKTCMAFKVQPSEIGFTEKVNKSSGETQENVQYRRSIKPTASYFANIYTDIIHTYFGLPNLYFNYVGLEEKEDAYIQAQVDEIYIKNGVKSPDEVRTEKGMDADEHNPVPRIFNLGSTIITVDDALAQSKAAITAENAGAGTETEEQPKADNPSREDATEDLPSSDEVSGTINSHEDAAKAANDFFPRQVRA